MVVWALFAALFSETLSFFLYHVFTKRMLLSLQLLCLYPGSCALRGAPPPVSPYIHVCAPSIHRLLSIALIPSHPLSSPLIPSHPLSIVVSSFVFSFFPFPPLTSPRQFPLSPSSSSVIAARRWENPRRRESRCCYPVSSSSSHPPPSRLRRRRQSRYPRWCWRCRDPESHELTPHTCKRNLLSSTLSPQASETTNARPYRARV